MKHFTVTFKEAVVNSDYVLHFNVHGFAFSMSLFFLPSVTVCQRKTKRFKNSLTSTMKLIGHNVTRCQVSQPQLLLFSSFSSAYYLFSMIVKLTHALITIK